MAGPSLADFAGHVGETYEVTGDDGAVVPLRLDSATALPASFREEGGFRLEWVGPGDPLLPQATYAFGRGGESVYIFIVPFARDSGGCRYEAIFV